MYVHGTAITTRFIEHTTQRSSLFNDLISMTDALQFVVYCNCAMQLTESRKYIWSTPSSKNQYWLLSNGMNLPVTLLPPKLCVNNLPLQNKCTNHTQQSPANKTNFTCFSYSSNRWRIYARLVTQIYCRNKCISLCTFVWSYCLLVRSLPVTNHANIMRLYGITCPSKTLGFINPLPDTCETQNEILIDWWYKNLAAMTEPRLNAMHVGRRTAIIGL
jgi:hypothetical protein